MNIPHHRSNNYNSKKLGWERFKLVTKSRLKYVPFLEFVLRKTWRFSKYYWSKAKWKMVFLQNYISGNQLKAINLDKLCWISPGIIKFSALKEFDITDFKGRVIGGDWDLLSKRFEDLDIYIAIKEVCIEGKQWENTIFYERISARINKGDVPWGCRDQHDLDRRCKEIEELYRIIRDEGYKAQYELSSELGSSDPLHLDNEIIVSIGRYGDLLFCNSAHRLAISKLIGIEKIPVKIAVRHPEWVKLLNDIYIYANELGGKTYQPILHPDLDDIPAYHDCEDRYEMIKSAMKSSRGYMLDIGANLGYFSSRFEDLGFDCVAVEVGVKERYLLSKIRRAENKSFKIIGKSVLEPMEEINKDYEVVLALNIFHHFLKTKETFNEFVIFLNKLIVRELFFEPHHINEYQMENAYKNYTPEGFVNFLLDNSKLSYYELIGHASDGRPLYRLF